MRTFKSKAIGVVILSLVFLITTIPALADDGPSLEDTIKFMTDELDSNGQFIYPTGFTASQLTYSIASFRDDIIAIRHQGQLFLSNGFASPIDSTSKLGLKDVIADSVVAKNATFDAGARVKGETGCGIVQVTGKNGKIFTVFLTPTTKSAQRLAKALRHAIELGKDAPKGPFDP